MRERFGLTLGVNALQIILYITCDDPFLASVYTRVTSWVSPKHLSDEVAVPLTAYAQNTTKQKQRRRTQQPLCRSDFGLPLGVLRRQAPVSRVGWNVLSLAN